MMEMIKAYAGLFKILAVALVVSGIWYYGHTQYVDGKEEIQTKWDADKAERKDQADQQAAETERLNRENKDALNKTRNDLKTAAHDRDIALARLRDLPPVLWGEGVLMAGGGEKAVSIMAGNPGGIGLRTERRIGGCANSSSDPCFVSRSFFEQTVRAVEDRGLTRSWAAGQKIKTVPRDQDGTGK